MARHVLPTTGTHEGIPGALGERLPSGYHDVMATPARRAVTLIVVISGLCVSHAGETVPQFTIPVLVVKYFSIKGANLDITDIGDWKPDGTGEKKRINCDRWNGDRLTWFIYWMQSLPGTNDGLRHEGRPLTNWWLFVGDYDRAMETKTGLVVR